MPPADKRDLEMAALRERLSWLGAGGLRIAEDLDLDAVLHRVLEGARLLTGAGRGGLTVIDDANCATTPTTPRPSSPNPGWATECPRERHSAATDRTSLARTASPPVRAGRSAPGGDQAGNKRWPRQDSNLKPTDCEPVLKPHTAPHPQLNQAGRQTKCQQPPWTGQLATTQYHFGAERPGHAGEYHPGGLLRLG